MPALKPRESTSTDPQAMRTLAAYDALTAVATTDAARAADLLRRAAFEWGAHAARMEACGMRAAESDPWRRRADEALRLARTLGASARPDGLTPRIAGVTE